MKHKEILIAISIGILFGFIIGFFIGQANSYCPSNITCPSCKECPSLKCPDIKKETLHDCIKLIDDYKKLEAKLK